jgi:ssRNA-specific RNase YbeY (16S rRNA maturation enzyme)
MFPKGQRPAERMTGSIVICAATAKNDHTREQMKETNHPNWQIEPGSAD